ncbi:glycosyltransferase [Dyadobacter alkalitolerans]|uniref:glycosyltransferase n=1 Tax=Dyadobacter alkalitolerans TaxID=492736 RepID=UPI0004017D34|nr:glycosyltransferase [Dyadobacter alkalitolerans]
MDIVITGQQAWDVEIGSNCKNIALEFSKSHRVLYVNAPLDRITAMRHSADPKIARRLRVLHKQENGLEEVEKNLWVLYPDRMIESINWISFDDIFKMFNARNNRIFVDSIARALKKLGFENVIHFNDNDIFRSFYIKDYLKPRLSVYYSRDYMIGVEYWAKHGAKLEPELIAKSDICVANSTYLAAYCKQYNPNTFYVGQGCDLALFSSGIGAAEPADIASIPGPRIGYVGALQNLRLDLELLHYIAVSRPAWQLVLVGPEDDVFKESTLHQLDNVIFTGSKNGDTLPAYINSFDVCLNPQLLNQLTIGNYPRKIDEYLALGKPVVATRTNAMDVFSDYVYLAENKEEYIIMIEKALAENSDAKTEERQAFAHSHSWENSVAEIYKAINAL